MQPTGIRAAREPGTYVAASKHQHPNTEHRHLASACADRYAGAQRDGNASAQPDSTARGHARANGDPNAHTRRTDGYDNGNAFADTASDANRTDLHPNPW
jgi:hypothetical protein